MNDNVILIVHSEAPECAMMLSMLQSLGHRLEESNSDRAAVRRLELGDVSLVVVCVDPNDPDALELLLYVRRKQPKVPVVLLFTSVHAERTREAIQRGAANVLRYPIKANELRAAVSQALGQVECRTVVAANGSYAAVSANANKDWIFQEGVAPAFNHPTEPGDEPRSPLIEQPVLLGEDQSFRQAVELAETIAPTRATVLIQGERGTGKCLLARSLHQQSPRRRGAFFEINCIAMQESALEVELFGRRAPGLNEVMPEQPGKIALAQGGTLFLDEVAVLSPDLQYKLLRVMQENAYEPVGSTQTLVADVRFVFGTKANLSEMVEHDRFRQDLYYRIGVVCLKLPPLRHRGADIERLAEHFRLEFVRKLDKDCPGFTPDALNLLRSYDWPGNVQELEAAIERAVLTCGGSQIEPAHLGLPSISNRTPRPTPSSNGRRGTGSGIRPLKEALEEPERRIILQALEALNWNRQETARVLDINRTTLYKKMKKYGLLFDDVRRPAWAN